MRTSTGTLSNWSRGGNAPARRGIASVLGTLLVAGAGLGGCAQDVAGPTTADLMAAYGVTEAVISHETTQEISVWYPEADGAWPVTFVFHGRPGTRQDLAITARTLASRGAVVFVPDYRSTAGPQQIQPDIECAQRYGRSVAADYGGDLGQPVTIVGYSAGATVALLNGLTDSPYPSEGTAGGCFTQSPRADIIVAIDGCHYGLDVQQSGLFSPATWSNKDAHVVLVAGTDDEICEPWQSQDATAELQAAGYDTSLVQIDGANHFTVIFHDIVDGEFLDLPDSPAGAQVVSTILEAIDAVRQ